eukprot:CAMPEP_0170616948 /NCGR_PEP_ID=MMETSP0224-20130122/26145_1 /TAXON_ID=285029 /ORGANISM="Togula jolla, Strain CCCM 725" /LENGTH=155 /DNA_ID=CAMNT_0010942785 /DNA_START=150 /DNA_END=615 /DNA_ORIENTATION=+
MLAARDVLADLYTARLTIEPSFPAALSRPISLHAAQLTVSILLPAGMSGIDDLGALEITLDLNDAVGLLLELGAPAALDVFIDLGRTGLKTRLSMVALNLCVLETLHTETRLDRLLYEAPPPLRRARLRRLVRDRLSASPRCIKCSSALAAAAAA